MKTGGGEEEEEGRREGDQLSYQLLPAHAHTYNVPLHKNEWHYS